LVEFWRSAFITHSEILISSASPMPLHPREVVGHVHRRLVRDIAPVDTQTNLGDYTVTLFLPIDLLDAYFVEADGGDLSRVTLALRELQMKGFVPHLSLALRKRPGYRAPRLECCVWTDGYRPRLRLIPG